MSKIAPDFILPDYGFQFLEGCSDEQLDKTIAVILNRYKIAFSKELELVTIPPCFAFGSINEPFVGVIWFKKIKLNNPRRNINYLCKKNFILPVCNIGLNHKAVLDDIEEELRAIGGELHRFRPANFKKVLLVLYNNLYEVAYYRYMLDKEKDPLRLRVMKFRASYDQRLIWRWHFGASMMGIKIKGGNFLYSLKTLNHGKNTTFC